MKSRFARLAKLREVRQKALDEKTLALKQQQLALERATTALQSAQAVRAKVEADRDAALTASISATQWEAVNDWLRHVQHAEQASVEQLLEANKSRARAKTELVAAKVSLKQAETLEERWRVRERAEAARAEQRSADEHTQNMHARTRRGLA